MINAWCKRRGRWKRAPFSEDLNNINIGNVFFFPLFFLLFLVFGKTSQVEELSKSRKRMCVEEISELKKVVGE